MGYQACKAPVSLLGTTGSANERYAPSVWQAPMLCRGIWIWGDSLVIGILAAMGAASYTSAVSTDFGIRTVHPARPEIFASVAVVPVANSRPNLSLAAALGARWGTVTSTHRSVERNKAVGGVRNSYHLVGRAVDIARRPGVRHAQIEAAFRRAGFHLMESLDEGDHSHFAFGSVQREVRARAPSVAKSPAPSSWRILYAPSYPR